MITHRAAGLTKAADDVISTLQAYRPLMVRLPDQTTNSWSPSPPRDEAPGADPPRCTGWWTLFKTGHQ